MLKPPVEAAPAGPSATPQPRPIFTASDAWSIAALGVASGLILVAPLSPALIGVLIFVACAARDRTWPLAIVVLTLPLQPLPRHIGSYEFSPTEIFIVLTAAGAIAGLAVRWPWRRRASGSAPGSARTATLGHLARRRLLAWPRDPVVSLLVVLLLLAAIVSISASVAVHESVQSLRVVIFEPVVFYFLASTVADRRRLAVILGLSLVMSGALISLFGIWQYVHGDRIITAEADLRRIRGFYGSPNNLGLFLDRSLPFAGALALWWRAARVPLLVALGLMLVALLMTFSVGAWVAVAGALGAIALMHGRRATLMAAIAGGGGIVLLVLAGALVPRIGSHFDLQSSTSAIRLDVWQSGLTMLRAHPIRGIGLDNFLYYYQHGYRLPAAWQDPNLSHPHNLILDFWLSLGLAGPILLATLLIRFVALARRAWTTSDSTQRGFIVGAASALVATVLHGFVDNSFFLPDLAVLFWLMFVIVAGVAEPTTTSPTV